MSDAFVGSADDQRSVSRKTDLRRGRRWCPWCINSGIDVLPERLEEYAGITHRRATHVGFGNGVALVEGCEFHMYMWRRGEHR